MGLFKEKLRRYVKMINDFHVHMGKSSRGTNYTVDDLLRSMDRFDIERSGLSILNGVLTPELNAVITGSNPVRALKKPRKCWLNSDKELIYLSTVS